MKVKVYRNLHKKCWSVIGPEGRVILRSPRVAVFDADFVVRPAGRRMFLESGRKTVHAFVVGTLCSGKLPSCDGLVPITYNPAKHETFIRRDNDKAVYCSPVVVLDQDGYAYALLTQEPKSPFKMLNFLFDHRKKILSPKAWASLFGTRIFDPDGWRKDDKSFDEPVGLDEFLDRVELSTIGPCPSGT